MPPRSAPPPCSPLSASAPMPTPPPLQHGARRRATPPNFGFDAVGVGIYVHVFGSVRSDGDYGLSGASSDILALPGNPVFGAHDPALGRPLGPEPRRIRGSCVYTSPETNGHPARSTPEHRPLTPPVAAPPNRSPQRRTDSWEEPGNFKEASYESADLAGNPVSLGLQPARVQTDDRSERRPPTSPTPPRASTSTCTSPRTSTWKSSPPPRSKTPSSPCPRA